MTNVQKLMETLEAAKLPPVEVRAAPSGVLSLYFSNKANAETAYTFATMVAAAPYGLMGNEFALDGGAVDAFCRALAGRIASVK